MAARFLIVVLAFTFAQQAMAAPRGPADTTWTRLAASIPLSAEQCRTSRTSELREAAAELEQWTADELTPTASDEPAQVLQKLARLVRVKQQVDVAVDDLLRLRTQFVSLPPGENRRELIRGYLQSTSQLFDLSGRLRASLRDAIDIAAYRLDSFPEQRDALFDLLITHKVSIGAAVVSYVLFDPPPETGEPFPVALKKKALKLLEVTAQVDMLPAIAGFLGENQAPAELMIEAAELVRRIGLPQDPRPGQDPPAPAPAITQDQLRQLLEKINLSEEDPSLADRRADLLAWLEQRKMGITGDSYRFGRLELRPGDWLLMRNPSPYNRFTDVAPGWFTHVGVVAAEEGPDGVRRFVLVDLPERGERIPATNVEVYLQRTLHYVFLRHNDARVGEKMGEAVLAVVGNETQFDLTFRTERVEALRGKPLDGQRINTYCAGFLLICAQASGAPREQFFPIPEYPAGGRCPANLKRMGISIGEDFISPTGAVFAPQLQIVGRREPMYSPGREIAEVVYDHFAHCMIHRSLDPSPNAFQAMRQNLAKLSTHNPWLARALARANNVSEHLDLESAAKAAAVVETLDEIANGGSSGFFYARNAVMAASPEQLTEAGVAEAHVERIRTLQERHAELSQRWREGRLSARQLRIELVEYYAEQGRRQVEQRFFDDPRLDPSPNAQRPQ